MWISAVWPPAARLNPDGWRLLLAFDPSIHDRRLAQVLQTTRSLSKNRCQRGRLDKVNDMIKEMKLLTIIEQQITVMVGYRHGDLLESESSTLRCGFLVTWA